MLRLAGAAGGRVLLARGDGKLLATNTTGVEVMALGADNNDQGFSRPRAIGSSIQDSQRTSNDSDEAAHLRRYPQRVRSDHWMHQG
jgi:hypothetical protein